LHRRVSGILAVLAPVWAAAAPAAGAVLQAEPPGSQLTVFLATFGPGDAVWEKFGHNAIWIHDQGTGSTVSYNYGIFDFEQPGFVWRLMKGSMLYSMGVRAAEADVDSYSWFNRSVTVQRLNLTAEQKHALREFLEWNWLPANRDYVYDYFRDNCSTRLRDALDRVLAGRIRESLSAVPSSHTYRSHSLRLTAGSPATFTGLLLGLGLPTDRPLNAWEESFIPMELMTHLRGITITDDDGRTAPLVLDERFVFEADRAPTRETPPSRTASYLLVGLLAAGVIAGLSHIARTRKMARVALAATVSVWGVATGFFGVILLLLWAFTDHSAAYPNLNLLLVNPIGWLLAVAAPLALGGAPAATGDGPARESFRVARLARPTALAALALATVALLLVPFVSQYNAPLIALLVPIHAAVVFALYHAARGGLSPIEDSIPAVSLHATA
jgi:hypothetical protein